MLWRLKVYELHCERDRKELSERLQQYSDCESFLFGAQTTIYISLFLIKAVVRAVKFVFAINIKKNSCRSYSSSSESSDSEKQPSVKGSMKKRKRKKSSEKEELKKKVNMNLRVLKIGYKKINIYDNG